MSDTFWVQLFSFLGIVAAIYGKHIVDRQASVAVSKKIDNVLPAVAEKVDSAEKKFVDTAQQVKDDNKKAADKLAINKVLADERVIDSVKQLTKTIKGDDGTCIAGRLKKLEEGHEVLVQGQVDLVKSVNHLAELLDRKIPNTV